MKLTPQQLKQQHFVDICPLSSLIFVQPQGIWRKYLNLMQREDEKKTKKEKEQVSLVISNVKKIQQYSK